MFKRIFKGKRNKDKKEIDSMENRLQELSLALSESKDLEDFVHILEGRQNKNNKKGVTRLIFKAFRLIWNYWKSKNSGAFALNLSVTFTAASALTAAVAVATTIAALAAVVATLALTVVHFASDRKWFAYLSFFLSSISFSLSFNRAWPALSYIGLMTITGIIQFFYFLFKEKRLLVEDQKTSAKVFSPDRVTELVIRYLKVGIIEKYRAEIIGFNSSHSKHVSELRLRFEEARTQENYWSGRLDDEPNNEIIVENCRLSAQLVLKFNEEIEEFQKAETEILDRLNVVERMVPIVSGEITDHYYAMRLSKLGDNLDYLHEQSMAVINTTLINLAYDIQQIQVAIADLRIKTLPTITNIDAVEVLDRRVERIVGQQLQ